MQINATDPAKTAMIVVDMQNDFVADWGSNGDARCTGYGPEAGGGPEKISRMIYAAPCASP